MIGTSIGIVYLLLLLLLLLLVLAFFKGAIGNEHGHDYD